MRCTVHIVDGSVGGGELGVVHDVPPHAGGTAPLLYSVITPSYRSAWAMNGAHRRQRPHFDPRAATHGSSRSRHREHGRAVLLTVSMMLRFTWRQMSQTVHRRRMHNSVCGIIVASNQSSSSPGCTPRRQLPQFLPPPYQPVVLLLPAAAATCQTRRAPLTLLFPSRRPPSSPCRRRWSQARRPAA